MICHSIGIPPISISVFGRLSDSSDIRVPHPPAVKLMFVSESKFFGPGPVGLLREIDSCGNVRDACEKCGFSYSKGWTILKKCEEKFGYTIDKDTHTITKCSESTDSHDHEFYGDEKNAE